MIDNLMLPPNLSLKCLPLCLLLLSIYIGYRHVSVFYNLPYRLSLVGTTSTHLLLGLHFVHTSSVIHPAASLLSASKHFGSKIPVVEASWLFNTLPPSTRLCIQCRQSGAWHL